MHKFPSPSFPAMGRSVRLIVSSSTLPLLPAPASSSSSLSMLIAASPLRCMSTSRPALAFGLAPGRSTYEKSNHSDGNNNSYDRPKRSYDRPNRSFDDRRPPRRSYDDDGNGEPSSYSRYGNDERRFGRNNNSYSKPSYQQQDKSKMYASRGCYNVSRRTSLRLLDLGTKKLMNPFCYSVETVSRCVLLGLWRCGTAQQRGDFGSRERRRCSGMSHGAKRQSGAFEDARRTLRGCG